MTSVISLPTTIRQGLPLAVTDTRSCNECRAMKATVVALETTIAVLQATVVALDERLEDLITQKSTTSSRQPPAPAEEIFSDRRLRRVRAAAFVTGDRCRNICASSSCCIFMIMNPLRPFIPTTLKQL